MYKRQEIYRTELRCRGIEDDEYVRRVFYGIGENLTEIDGIIAVSYTHLFGRAREKCKGYFGELGT